MPQDVTDGHEDALTLRAREKYATKIVVLVREVRDVCVIHRSAVSRDEINGTRLYGRRYGRAWD